VNGRAHLGGVVVSREEHELALELARSVAGVVAVVDELVELPTAERGARA
jgi:osmotically-inducible protein OsmY